MNLRRQLIIVLLAFFPLSNLGADTIRVGSKNFNESYILSEIVSQLLEVRGYQVERKFGLGGTLICYEALRNQEIDLYVEYTGTLSQAILNLSGNPEAEALNKILAPQGVELLEAFGFNNTYAIAVREQVAEANGLRTIGDLRNAPNLEVVVSHEFLERADGWPGLARTYGLEHAVRGIEHGLAYQAINTGSIGVTDAYSTDGELIRYALTVLEDDLSYFPSYHAAPLVHSGVSRDVRDAIAPLAGTINEALMQQMNAQVVFEGKDRVDVAAEFLAELGVVSITERSSMWRDLVNNTLRHLQLTGIALFFAIVVGLGLSIATYRHERIANFLIYVSGLMQTIPSIALLALMIPLFGIGFVPAVVALFLYSLLPILRNATTALTHVDPVLVDVATAMGLSERDRLTRVMLPLSLPAIFAGIKTAAVISIGTATLAAFIGAGGLGDPIVVGLSLDDVNLILQGAIPAALLAIVTELAFSLLERRIAVRA